MMQLDKLNMSDPKTVTAVVGIGALFVAMCVQLVFLFATLFKSAGSSISLHSPSVSPHLYHRRSSDRGHNPHPRVCLVSCGVER